MTRVSTRYDLMYEFHQSVVLVSPSDVYNDFLYDIAWLGNGEMHINHNDA